MLTYCCHTVTLLKEGSEKLKTGAISLYDGTGKLKDGAGSLKDGAGKVDDGVVTLLDGIITLDDGMNEFDEKGIEKISKVYNDNVLPVKGRFTAIKEASKAYNTFSGIEEGKSGTCKFIFTTEAIK